MRADTPAAGYIGLTRNINIPSSRRHGNNRIAFNVETDGNLRASPWAGCKVRRPTDFDYAGQLLECNHWRIELQRPMNSRGDEMNAVLLRNVVETDLPIFFQQQLDPVADHMALNFFMECATSLEKLDLTR